MINTVKAIQDLLDVGFTHRQATAVVKALQDTASNFPAEFDRRSAARHKEGPDRLPEANGARDAECDQLTTRLELFEHMDEGRHKEAVAQFEALWDRLARQLSDTEQKLLQELSELEQSVSAQLFALRCEITVKAAAITNAIHATGVATLIVVGLAALGALVLI